jgi:hypothetical protein
MKGKFMKKELNIANVVDFIFLQNVQNIELIAEIEMLKQTVKQLEIALEVLQMANEQLINKIDEENDEGK